MSPTILGLDPGTRSTGWAVLKASVLREYGTLIPKNTLRGVDRHLWLLSQIQDLLATYQPGVLAYEEFVWISHDNTHDRYISGRPDMERLIGGIQLLSLYTPYPVLMGLLPAKWGQQLLGQRTHTKAQIAYAVNCRLKTTFKGDIYDNHACDAVGIALVAADTVFMERHVAAQA